MTKTVKINDYCRVKFRDNGSIQIETRSDTGRGCKFGSAQNCRLTEEEMKTIIKEYQNL